MRLTLGVAATIPDAASAEGSERAHLQRIVRRRSVGKRGCLDAEFGGLVGELLDVLMLLHQQFLRLREVLELEVDVAGLHVVARLQPVDLEAKLRDAVLIGHEDRVALAGEELRDVGRHQDSRPASARWWQAGRQSRE